MNLSSASASRAPLAPTVHPSTGVGPPQDGPDSGWLGQVPPPEPPATPACPAPEAATYAIPQLAPDPWLDPGPLYPHDSTLFG